MLASQSSEGRDYLLSLEHVAAWVAERVLPFLSKRPNNEDEEEEKDMERSRPLAAQITEVSSTMTCKNTHLFIFIRSRGLQTQN